MAKLSASQLSNPAPRPPLNLLQNPTTWLSAFWKFSRPHTIVGTSLSVVGLFAIAWAGRYSPWTNPGTLLIWRAVTALLLTWLACLAGNVFIVGLNQVEDVEIDRINKPHLPIASGEFSRPQAIRLVVLCGVAAMVLAVLSHSLYLMATIWVSLAIGSAYSVPPIRLKRFPFWASVCILTVRGAIVNLGIYLHAASQIGLKPTVPARVWALTLFILVFSFAIAIFKDIPDIEGDRRYNITTLTLQLGQVQVFNLARWVLTACYGGMMVAAPFLPGVHQPLLLGTHAIALAGFWYRSRQVELSPSKHEDAENEVTVRKSVSYANFYQFIWLLFFAEYIIFSAACLMTGFV
ncbi:homogentisate phytyltransferase [Romeria aff. gracilis LEGE 07310]|uniref:Homogentisate phytyltransferase n=1 Tax=Vasconcelosia minhoensis LEGE 07310 TaxID=915328 RepID=A0A8J7ALE4_9CYAN|nr:homogentisate phytyltransferase [Romeria gracilis]MBE9076734.1 homogentisate phytyltransferase [Romeria aff. gracilis LEGE 07310]